MWCIELKQFQHKSAKPFCEKPVVSYLSEKPKVVEEKNVASHRLFSAFFPGKFLSRINYVSFQFEYLGIKDVRCLGGDNSLSQKYLLTRWTNYLHHPLLQLLCARFPWVPKVPLDKFTRVSAMLKNTLKKLSSAVFWRKVILVIFVIFELGPDSESLCIAPQSESISCGIRAIFHPKNCNWSFGSKKWEKS